MTEEREISLDEINQIIKNMIEKEEEYKDEAVSIRPPGYKDLTEILEDVIIKAVIGMIRENKYPEPNVNEIVRRAARTIIQTSWDCVNQDCALMTRRIYKTLEEEGYWS